MTIVLDASVALKLVTSEPGTAEAQTLLERGEERIAPDWMLAEVASGLINKVRFQGLDADLARAGFAAMPRFVDRFVAALPLLDRVMELAVEIDHPVYDCIYLLLAIDEEGRVVTADDGLVKSARQAGYADRMERLTWQP